MLLVSYLNHLAEVREPLPADHEAYLASMIRVSDNDAATAIYSHVRDNGLLKLAATDPQVMKDAPVTTPVRRLDDVKAAKELDVAWRDDVPATTAAAA